MCEFCQPNGDGDVKSIVDSDFYEWEHGIISVDCGIAKDELFTTVFNDEFGECDIIAVDFPPIKIKYCPMCGRNL